MERKSNGGSKRATIVVGIICTALAGIYLVLLVAAAVWSAVDVHDAFLDGFSLLNAVVFLSPLLVLLPIGINLVFSGHVRAVILAACGVLGTVGAVCTVVAAIDNIENGLPPSFGPCGPQGSVLAFLLICWTWLLGGMAAVFVSRVIMRVRRQSGSHASAPPLWGRIVQGFLALIASVLSIVAGAMVVLCCLCSLPFAAMSVASEKLVFLGDGLFGYGRSSVVYESFDVLCEQDGKLVFTDWLEPGDVVAANVFVGTHTMEYPSHLHVRWGMVLSSEGPSATVPYRETSEDYLTLDSDMDLQVGPF